MLWCAKKHIDQLLLYLAAAPPLWTLSENSRQQVSFYSFWCVIVKKITVKIERTELKNMWVLLCNFLFPLQKPFCNGKYMARQTQLLFSHNLSNMDLITLNLISQFRRPCQTAHVPSVKWALAINHWIPPSWGLNMPGNSCFLKFSSA